MPSGATTAHRRHRPPLRRRREDRRGLDRRRGARLLAGWLLPVASAVLFSCQPVAGPQTAEATLPATLSLQTTPEGLIAFQNGIVVPSFDPQPGRDRLDLGSGWRLGGGGWDETLTFSRRTPEVVAALEQSAAGRTSASYPDASWSPIQVPGTMNPPPQAGPSSAWYRVHFSVPLDWLSTGSTLKFGAAGYLADVWLNGHYLGYHEGSRTPFAFDVAPALALGGDNVLAVHVENPPPGLRDDIVPWGLIDWWRYGGLTQPVWLEATPEVAVARADVRPHLDGAELGLVVENRSRFARHPALHVSVLPAEVTAQNLLSPDPLALVPAGAAPIASFDLDPGSVPARSAVRVDRSLAFRSPDLWSPGLPALYVLRVLLDGVPGPRDQLVESFGLRRVGVDPNAPRLLLNGDPVFLRGVALHDEVLTEAGSRYPAGSPILTWEQQKSQLDRARSVNADFIRADHSPPNPMLLTLADRLGFAVWEEIPLYHFRPPEFALTMQRGIPQQMLAEMALRDFDHPSVLFHGLSNESSGDQERKDALTELRDLDRRLDGTRLTGQASYGSPPGDSTSSGLDVAGYTFYYGVFYGPSDPGTGTAAALQRAHATLPQKPVLILEFGRWADTLEQESDQLHVLESTLPAIEADSDLETHGFVGAAVWWSLEDYWSEEPGLAVEHFGLFRPDGTPRPAAGALKRLFAGAGGPPGGSGADRPRASGGSAVLQAQPAPGHVLLYLGYGTAVAIAALGLALLALLRFGAAPTREDRP